MVFCDDDDLQPSPLSQWRHGRHCPYQCRYLVTRTLIMSHTIIWPRVSSGRGRITSAELCSEAALQQVQRCRYIVCRVSTLHMDCRYIISIVSTLNKYLPMCRYIVQYLEGRYQCCNRRIVSIKPNIFPAELRGAAALNVNIVVNFSAAPDLSWAILPEDRDIGVCVCQCCSCFHPYLFVLIVPSLLPSSLPAAQRPTLPL